jgi:hypothetical protein
VSRRRCSDDVPAHDPGGYPNCAPSPAVHSAAHQIVTLAAHGQKVPLELAQRARDHEEAQREAIARKSPADDMAVHALAIYCHFNGKHHLSGGCGPVCTFGDY